MKTTRPNKTNGFAAVMALLLLVVFALLGTFMITTSGVQHMSTTLSHNSAQALLAARSGIEWAIFSARNGLACTSIQGRSFISEGYNITLECTESGPFYEGTDPTANFAMYDLRSTATPDGNISAGSPAYVRRVAQSIIRIPP